MRYFKGTIYHGIAYGGKEAEFDNMRLNCYTDSDYAKDRIQRRSYSGYAVFFSDGLILALSKLQSIVALSSTEAEYIALVRTIQEALWLRILLIEIGYTSDDAQKVLIHIDNLSAKHLAKNPEFH